MRKLFEKPSKTNKNFHNAYTQNQIGKVIKQSKPSSIFIGKIWTRFYFNPKRHNGPITTWKTIIWAIIREEWPHHIGFVEDDVDIREFLSGGMEWHFNHEEESWGLKLNAAKDAASLAYILMLLPWTSMLIDSGSSTLANTEEKPLSNKPPSALRKLPKAKPTPV